jgi:putative endonuclease
MSAEERWYLYVLRCADQTLYTGIARDVKKRLIAHESGKGARYTRGRGPFVVLATRRCQGHGAALRLEYAVKQLTRAEKEQLTIGRRLAVFARNLANSSSA